MARANSKLSSVTVKLPWVEGTWVADEAQQLAAWEMYVELVTRISVQPLGPDDGLLREALSSLYVLFGETRRILRTYGPSVATPLEKGTLSFGAIAVDVLNVALRPLLSKWHPLLLDRETQRPAATSTSEHEDTWPLAKDLRAELAALRGTLVVYASLLASVCGVPSLHDAPEPALE